MIGEFIDDMGTEYMMLMNKDYNQQISPQIALNKYVDDLEFFNLDTESWQKVTIEQSEIGTAFNFQFLPGGGTLFKVGQEISGTHNNNIRLALKFKLEQNFPNPFNSTTIITYSLANTEHIVITIFDLLGRKVETLMNEEQNAGEYKVIWDAKNYASGIYFCQYQAGSILKSRKMLLLK
jgi:hypothetical protein